MHCVDGAFAGRELVRCKIWVVVKLGFHCIRYFGSAFGVHQIYAQMHVSNYTTAPELKRQTLVIHDVQAHNQVWLRHSHY